MMMKVAMSSAAMFVWGALVAMVAAPLLLYSAGTLMDWYRSEADCIDHPKTTRLARLLGVSQIAALGHLHALWSWAARFAEDGDLSRYDAGEIAAGARWEGRVDFVAALTEAQESRRPVPWAPSDAPDDYINAMLRGIVGLEIEITEIRGKWKMSQNRLAQDADGAARGLADPDDPHHDPDVAAIVAERLRARVEP